METIKIPDDSQDCTNTAEYFKVLVSNLCYSLEANRLQNSEILKEKLCSLFADGSLKNYARELCSHIEKMYKSSDSKERISYARLATLKTNMIASVLKEDYEACMRINEEIRKTIQSNS